MIADTHGFYDETMGALTSAGFFSCKENKKLIVCGDLLDRGRQSVKMQDFMMCLHNEGELIFIRGNHEDLMLDLIENYDKYEASLLYEAGHHWHNGTYKAALQLTGFSPRDAYRDKNGFIDKLKKSSFVDTLIKNSVNYYEISNYIFVHGWIPSTDADWRFASEKEWEKARWYNGMERCLTHGIREPDKTIVCGHWHTSWGHGYLQGEPISPENDKANLSIFYYDGIIALDACTVISRKVNCVVIDD